MKVIVPLAGLGKRMRPHTWSKPKPLINVAGKPILGHILDKIAPLEDVEEVIFIVGWLGAQITEYVEAHYHFPTRYFVQHELKGQAHAVILAKEYLTGPCLIVFVDTLFEADLSVLKKHQEDDAVLFVQEVEDPRRFGVVVEEQGRVKRIIEKPTGLEYRKAIIGLYYIREGQQLAEAIDYLISHNMQTQGEFYLADAFQIMIDRGTKFHVAEVDNWLDAGTSQALLQTNRLLLERGRDNIAALNAEGFVIIPPVYIHPTAKITNSVIGPYVTLGKNCRVENCIIRDSIVDADSMLENILISGSLVGQNVDVKGVFHSINVGDSTSLHYE